MRGSRGVGATVVAIVVVVVVAAVAVARHHHHSTGSPSTVQGHVSPVASVTPTALLTGAAAHFDAATGGWSGDGAVLSRGTATTHHGGGALVMTSSTPGGGALRSWSPPRPATAGDRYTGSAWIRGVTSPRAARMELRFIDGSGAVTDTESVAQTAVDSTSAWTHLPLVAAIAPKGSKQVELGVSFPIVGAGGQHLVDDASLTSTPGGSTRVVGPLTVSGSQILQATGKPLVMRGLQRFGLEGGTKTPLPTDAEIGQLKQWGANEVRISLGQQKWLSTNCHYQSDYTQRVDDIVRWVTSRGMVALLNLHFATLTDCGPPGLTAMAESPGAVTFWQEVASRYRSNPLVAFDLFNEPHVSDSTWLNGGSFTESGLTLPAVGMQQLYDTVRGTGATNLVVVSGNDYASQPPPHPVAGFNIAYGAHAYTCSNAPPPTCTAPAPYDASVPLHHWVTFGATHPVVVTEFGWPDGDNGTYNTAVIDYAESHGWGWSGFAWDGGTDGKFDLVQAHPASDGSTIEPNAGGMPLVAGFAANTAAHAH